MQKKKRGKSIAQPKKQTKQVKQIIISKEFDKNIRDLSEQELRELLMINMYKMALIRSQLEVVTNVLIKNKLATYEEIWKETNDNFKNTI